GAFEVQAVPTPYAAQVQQPINADGTSVFSVRRGVVPVKFTLTQGGVATCTLPPATIAATRTSGGATGAIDESVYTGSADTGSNFRISNCQYIYNLSASALGVGTYCVKNRLRINAQPDRCNYQPADCQTRQRVHRYFGTVRRGLPIHRANDFEVIIKSAADCEHAHDNENRLMLSYGCVEDKKLSYKSRRERHTGKRDHSDQHRECEKRRT